MVRSVAAAAGGGVAGDALQPPTVLVPASVTDPREVVSALPARTALVPSVTPALATTFPAKLTPFRVAALVTCQNTWHGSTPTSVTFELTLAVRELATLKMYVPAPV